MSIKQLRAEREAHKQNLQIFGDFLNTFETDQIIQLKLRLEKFEGILDEFERVQLEIEQEEACTKKDKDDRVMFTNAYFELMSRGKEFLRHRDNITQGPGNETNITTASIEAKIKLPQLALPSFDGEQRNWVSFRDNFVAIIHNNNMLPEIEKFRYLRGQLTGAAAVAIQNLQITELNYQIAWDILKERFENKRQSVEMHIREILNFKMVAKQTYNDLRNMLDTLTVNLRSLETLGVETDAWDAILIQILTGKLDTITYKEWRAVKLVNELPTLNEFKKFLNDRCKLLEGISAREEVTKNIKERVVSFAIRTEEKCCFCDEQHKLYACQEFVAQSLQSRKDTVKKLGLCWNCMKKGHRVFQCKTRGCYKCGGRHHTLLHGEATKVITAAGGVGSNADSEAVTVAVTSSNCFPNLKSATTQVVLSTAVVNVEDGQGIERDLRALLDCASQSSFITEAACELLGLKKYRKTVAVNGIGEIAGNVAYAVNVKVKSRCADFVKTIECLVLKRITGSIPTVSHASALVKVPPNIRLADEGFYKQSGIDLLLGANVFWDILNGERIQNSVDGPLLQNTRLGWIVAGNLNSYESQTLQSQSFCALSESLQKFWRIEELSDARDKETEVENFCERNFIENTIRNEDGRFVVTMPLTNDVNGVGNSRERALKRLLATERRLTKNTDLRNEYRNFMKEYLAEGHMTEIIETPECQNETYYLPHHAIIKETSLTTKLRVVFDASMKAENGVSLNDMQLVGPKVQDDLWAILIRFRGYKYVLSADIAKMYLQILINKKQRDLQRVLWRFDENGKINCYTMNTVTFGMASSPFLATRCLKQLAIENQCEYPETSYAILKGFYMDDLLTGANTVAETITLRKEITGILKTAKFSLRKWLSNDQRTINDLNGELNSEERLRLGENQPNKTLGIYWQAREDSLRYSIKNFEDDVNVTKRIVLSTISQIFDPLGLIGPVIVVGKVMMQQLWKLKIGWDEPLPPSVLKRWLQFKSCLRQEYWPIGGRNLVKKICHDCVRCFRIKPNSVTHIMGSLPEERVVPAPPFYNSGVDFAGPYLIRDRKSRGCRTTKCYISLFVCFVTKAIHIELVGDLSTDGFIQALRRFIARRGKPKTIFSDNATNFVGAKNELDRITRDVYTKKEIVNFLTNEGVEWKFIPPRSPHFGGLWEAGVKSVKFHLKRGMGAAALIYEELNTVLTQIEAILNSRPLCPLSSNVSDLDPLTPGHFLIGRTLTSLPDSNLEDIPENRLSRYQRVQRVVQTFWKRWHQEYLTGLQEKRKWRQGNSHQLRLGDLVVLQDDNLPPCQWRMGRVHELHPGLDDVLRVVSIKTVQGVVKRSVRRICVLPMVRENTRV